MIHQFRDKKRIAKQKNIIRNASLIGVVLILIVSGILSWFPNILNRIGKPIWKIQNTVMDTTYNASQVARTNTSVFNENETLKRENEDIKNKLVDYDAVVNENKELREILGRMSKNESFTLSAILAKPNKSPYDTIIIDVGANMGVIEGAKVFVGGNIPIGNIKEVYQGSSLVALYSNPGQTTEGIIDVSNETVQLIGRGGGNFEMTIPTDLSIENGRLVLLPGSKREVLAIVDGQISTPTDPAKKVLLRSPINIQSLKWVQIKRN